MLFHGCTTAGLRKESPESHVPFYIDCQHITSFVISKHHFWHVRSGIATRRKKKTFRRCDSTIETNDGKDQARKKSCRHESQNSSGRWFENPEASRCVVAHRMFRCKVTSGMPLRSNSGRNFHKYKLLTSWLLSVQTHRTCSERFIQRRRFKD